LFVSSTKFSSTFSPLLNTWSISLSAMHVLLEFFHLFKQLYCHFTVFTCHFWVDSCHEYVPSQHFLLPSSHTLRQALDNSHPWLAWVLFSLFLMFRAWHQMAADKQLPHAPIASSTM
jgi:hypothetical protein